MVVDFHSHILPGIDDGSDSVEQSLELLRIEAAQGVTHVIATPHFYAHSNTPENFLQERAAAEAKLRKAMEGEPGLPKLTVGAEVFYFPGICDVHTMQDLTIGDSAFIMIEMPTPPWSEDVYRDLEQIELRQGLVPIIAHIDRYLTFMNRAGICRKLNKLSALVQANGRFFRNPKTRRTALKMLKKGYIHLLGSDCHDTVHRRPDLRSTVEEITRVDATGIDWIKSWEKEVLGK